MQAENADSAGLNRFPIRPATFARSAWASAGPKRNVRTIYIDRQTGSALNSQGGGSLTLAPIIVYAGSIRKNARARRRERGPLTTSNYFTIVSTKRGDCSKAQMSTSPYMESAIWEPPLGPENTRSNTLVTK